VARGEASVTRSKKPENTDEPSESLVRVFFRGFFLPVKLIGRGLAWISHQPPLKQVGHGLRWFFRLRAVRFIGRILGLRFFRNSWRELKQVTWPSRRDGIRLTSAVISFSVVFAVILAGVDWGLDKIFKQLLLK
jgi:preprotein translocase SecE subunit